MALLEVSFQGEDPGLSIRHVKLEDGLSRLFEIEIVAASPVDDLALDALIGGRATFSIDNGDLGGVRRWGGVCTHFEQRKPEDKGLATYAFVLRPSLWLLSQRTNCRIFQHLSTPEIVTQILGEWEIKPTWSLDQASFPRFEFKVQYGESDFAFVSRLLEHAGISYAFDFSDDGSTPNFTDHPEKKEARAGAIPYADLPHPEVRKPFATAVTIRRELAPGAFVVQDHDFRKRPDLPLLQSAPAATGIEARLEQYVYRPGAFLTEGTADSSHVASTDDAEGVALVARSLDAARSAKRVVVFETNLSDLAPGTVLSISGHPQPAISGKTTLLVVKSEFEGGPLGAWTFRTHAVTTDAVWCPPVTTPRPRITGVQSAIVVGPSGDEIHTEELGRVKVQFPWDRYGQNDEYSSCFLRVSQGWAGAGYGVFSVPRVGQEVTVAFIEGDPDLPIIVGRVHNVVSQAPYALPEKKTRTAWRSQSTPNGGDGHNELMFEDEAGAELISLRAERDLMKLVKQNETERTGVDRTSSVGRARSLTVGGVDSTMVGVRHVVAIGGGDAPATTSWEMTDKRIVATTGDATVTFDGPNLAFEAKGNITIVSREGDVIIKGGPNVKINST